MWKGRPPESLAVAAMTWQEAQGFHLPASSGFSWAWAWDLSFGLGLRFWAIGFLT
ncbi:hypothetical protein RchiOBHm_Chr2g0162981 [Rosa chinensis]|uniref:Uncharacterized protein n=1 Tax=Rosa chinensis TaxID=74649 RepID=A0A2P6S356_ROSCH|nr:hypothetical protein RchiOBHm_Chr2g0162981 [Rosa chinensis]